MQVRLASFVWAGEASVTRIAQRFEECTHKHKHTNFWLCWLHLCGHASFFQPLVQKDVAQILLHNCTQRAKRTPSHKKAQFAPCLHSMRCIHTHTCVFFFFLLPAPLATTAATLRSRAVMHRIWSPQTVYLFVKHHGFRAKELSAPHASPFCQMSPHQNACAPA